MTDPTTARQDLIRNVGSLFDYLFFDQILLREVLADYAGDESRDRQLPRHTIIGWHDKNLKLEHGHLLWTGPKQAGGSVAVVGTERGRQGVAKLLYDATYGLRAGQREVRVTCGHQGCVLPVHQQAVPPDPTDPPATEAQRAQRIESIARLVAAAIKEAGTPFAPDPTKPSIPLEPAHQPDPNIEAVRAFYPPELPPTLSIAQAEHDFLDDLPDVEVPRG